MCSVRCSWAVPPPPVGRVWLPPTTGSLILEICRQINNYRYDDHNLEDQSVDIALYKHDKLAKIIDFFNRSRLHIIAHFHVLSGIFPCKFNCCSAVDSLWSHQMGENRCFSIWVNIYIRTKPRCFLLLSMAKTRD